MELIHYLKEADGRPTTESDAIDFPQEIAMYSTINAWAMNVGDVFEAVPDSVQGRSGMCELIHVDLQSDTDRACIGIREQSYQDRSVQVLCMLVEGDRTFKVIGRIVTPEGEDINSEWKVSESGDYSLLNYSDAPRDEGFHGAHAERIYLVYHPATPIEIKEPIGFDDLTMAVKRSDLHGISLESSETDLEFYGEAFNVIKNHYDTDIDSALEYLVKHPNGDVLLRSAVDLSTCSFKYGDYQSVSCKIGDVGVKTILNNRVDTDVDLNTGKTIDGDELMMKAEWKSIAIPEKHLLYTNLAQQKYEQVYNNLLVSNAENWHTYYIALALSDSKGEFGTFGGSTSTFPSFPIDSPIYNPEDDHSEKFGTDSKYNTEVHIKLNLYSPIIKDAYMTASIALMNSSGDILLRGVPVKAQLRDIPSFGWYWNNIELNGEITDIDALQNLYLMVILQSDAGTLESYSRFRMTIMTDSILKMTMYDTLEYAEVKADMLHVHEAMNVITGAISENEISVKSQYYGRFDSKWNPEHRDTDLIGDGAMKAITNGYKIRNLFTTGMRERNMPISFKGMIEALNAMDCIGWCFENGDDGRIYVRVENWEYFYPAYSILSLSGANDVKVDIDTDRIYTELKIGYKKYETAEAFNSIDSVHGERTFTSPVKAVSKKKNVQCDFIADNYAIEEQRRARYSMNESEQSKYDEYIFVFELEGEMGIDMNYAVSNNVISASGVDRPDEQINVQLSPRRCADRWAGLLFQTSSEKDMRFTSGKINYMASFECHSKRDDGKYYLADDSASGLVAENADITNSRSILNAETISFSYPISIDQYKAILANPYGLVEVNGMKGWIKQLKYKISEGMADFKLIAKR